MKYHLHALLICVAAIVLVVLMSLNPSGPIVISVTLVLTILIMSHGQAVAQIPAVVERIINAFTGRG